MSACFQETCPRPMLQACCMRRVKIDTHRTAKEKSSPDVIAQLPNPSCERKPRANVVEQKKTSHAKPTKHINIRHHSTHFHRASEHAACIGEEDLWVR